jgi:hypothetical protein
MIVLIYNSSRKNVKINYLLNAELSGMNDVISTLTHRWKGSGNLICQNKNRYRNHKFH